MPIKKGFSAKEIQRQLGLKRYSATLLLEAKKISKKLQIDFYFANLYASWERGLNEYTNKLIRQYIPKETDFETVTHMQIEEIQYEINRRPREKLNFETPKSQFYKLVA